MAPFRIVTLIYAYGINPQHPAYTSFAQSSKSSFTILRDSDNLAMAKNSLGERGVAGGISPSIRKCFESRLVDQIDMDDTAC
jgi:hypothetical protein